MIRILLVYHRNILQYFMRVLHCFNHRLGFTLSIKSWSSRSLIGWFRRARLLLENISATGASCGCEALARPEGETRGLMNIDVSVKRNIWEDLPAGKSFTKPVSNLLLMQQVLKLTFLALQCRFKCRLWVNTNTRINISRFKSNNGSFWLIGYNSKIQFLFKMIDIDYVPSNTFLVFEISSGCKKLYICKATLLYLVFMEVFFNSIFYVHFSVY